MFSQGLTLLVFILLLPISYLVLLRVVTKDDYYTHYSIKGYVLMALMRSALAMCAVAVIFTASGLNTHDHFILIISLSLVSGVMFALPAHSQVNYDLAYMNSYSGESLAVVGTLAYTL